MTVTTTNVPEFDRILSRMSDWLERTTPEGKAKLAFSRQDTQWLLGEIEGGREAFGVLMDTNAGLRNEVGRMRQTIDTLMAMRGKPHG